MKRVSQSDAGELVLEFSHLSENLAGLFLSQWRIFRASVVYWEL